MTAPRDASAAALMAEWKDVPIGTPVVVLRDSGNETRTKTRSAPWLLGSGHPVILLEGISGGYALHRVKRSPS